MRRLLILALLALLLLLGVFGPRVSIDHQITRIALPEDLDAYLATSEARFDDLRPGTEKTILWAHPDRRRTRLSLVYLHGFSATRREVAPLAERVAESLGANLYFARLTGHGRSSEAMGKASLQDWLDDAREALAIGHRIGERVVVMGTSTGGTLATWLCLQPEEPAPWAAVLISPNFGPRRWESELLTWPWARYIVPLIQGDTYAWTPHNADHRRYWTSRFPVEALFTMAASVELVRGSDPASLRTPVLVFYSPEDRVVDVRRIEHFFEQLTVEPRALVAIEDSGDPQHHVLAGDILSPGTTERIASRTVVFLQRAAQRERR
jgi:alpha-beta hydrolase superfamily lysophospholipase